MHLILSDLCQKVKVAKYRQYISITLQIGTNFIPIFIKIGIKLSKQFNWEHKLNVIEIQAVGFKLLVTSKCCRPMH